MAVKVTIFGGTGFIGRYVIDRMADAGCVIRVATRRPSCAYFLKTAGAVGQVAAVQCDIHDDASVKNAVDGADMVINLIGLLAEGKGKNSFENVHHLFPKRLAKICSDLGVEKLTHISAIGVDKDAVFTSSG